MFLAATTSTPVPQTFCSTTSPMAMGAWTLTVLTGVLRDKDYHRMYAPLLPYAAQFITVTPDSPRALPAQELAAYLQTLGRPVTPCDTVAEGAALALAT